jgi:hypothetical protein
MRIANQERQNKKEVYEGRGKPILGPEFYTKDGLTQV